MDYNKYIFVDYNNIQNINIDNINENIKIIIIIGKNKKLLSINLIQKTQPFGKSIEWQQIKNNGEKSLLDFFIDYFLEFFISWQDNKEFVICSKNKKLDPLIEFLQNKNINIKRIERFNQTENKNTFIRKTFEHISSFWKNLKVIQKICFSTIVIAVIIGIIAILPLSSPSMVSVFDRPIYDEAILDRIAQRINQEGIKTFVTPNGLVKVSDEKTARRMRVILINEDLLPFKIDPWQVFDKERWTITDMERNINFQRALERMITEHIKAIEGIDNVKLKIVWPKKELFSEEKPTKASVIIFPKPGSDITQNRKKIEGIQRLLQTAIEGLQLENIVIIDQAGNIINNFEMGGKL